MIPAPIPENDDVRVAILREHITPACPMDDGLQAIARGVAGAVGVPIALVSLVDAQTQFFGGCVGLNGVTGTKRDVAFCAHTILQDEVLEVPDASVDPRFSANPLVTGAPHIRFYAGAPLTSEEGVRLGTLCLIDNVPRILSSDQRRLLVDMADAASRVLRKLRSLTRANSDLNRALEVSREAERSKTAFLASISHELRTPLNAVIGFSGLIEQEPYGPLPDPRYAEYLGDIRRSGEHLLSLINDLLDISRIEAGKHRLSPEELCVQDEVRWVTRMLAPLAESYGVSLGIDAPSDEVVMVTDRRGLRQVITNLVTNGIKYAGRGASVRVEVSFDYDAATIRVIDDGPGMDARLRARLFKPFTRGGDVHAARAEGTGLGLALCKGLVELAGGSIGLESAPGAGTCVDVRLPDLAETGSVVQFAAHS